MTRKSDLNRLYNLLGTLREKVGGYRTLGESNGYMDWPERGVYFFFAPDETRTVDDQLRITHVGTHAVSDGSKTTLWDRLYAHRGTFKGKRQGGGNHRGSVFRLRVGEAIINRRGIADEYPDWGDGSSATTDIRDAEYELEKQVSEFIRELPLLWVEINDEPGPESQRAVIKRNAIALLSNYQRDSFDSRKETWLGGDSDAPEIRESGLWNVNHVDENHSPVFLDRLSDYIDRM
jgi:hypothetical protein